MLTGKDTEPPRTSFRGPSPRLAAAKPSNRASGEFMLDSAQTEVSGKIKVLNEMIRLELN